jgi:hypothetical protein
MQKNKRANFSKVFKSFAKSFFFFGCIIVQKGGTHWQATPSSPGAQGFPGNASRIF